MLPGGKKLKNLFLRVRKQNENALKLAAYLEENSVVKKV
jgi:cystathionine beta-lyase/cystathionine gamma-synthase